MQGGRGRGNPFFGFSDPFANFGGMPSLFGGRDPFDDPFFTRPLGGISHRSLFGSMGSPFMDINPFGSSLFGQIGSPFMDANAPRYHEHRQSLPNVSRGPIIEELNSDDEKEEAEAGESKIKNAQMHGRPERQPYVELPDDETEGREPKQTQNGNQFGIVHDTSSRPQAHSFTFQSSSVTYGGSNGAYYTSSTTKRTGSDGLRFEEHKEADSLTGQAAHRLSRGLHNRGHTVTRNLKSDGQVDTMQMLHNINEDELAGFEDAWKGKARKHLPGFTGASIAHEGSGEHSRSLIGGRRKPDAIENVQSSKIRRV